MPTDLSNFYQWSSDLTDWHEGDRVDGPVGGSTVTISSESSGATTTVTATTSESIGRFFLRAGVSQN